MKVASFEYMQRSNTIKEMTVQTEHICEWSCGFICKKVSVNIEVESRNKIGEFKTSN